MDWQAGLGEPTPLIPDPRRKEADTFCEFRPTWSREQKTARAIV